MTTFAGRPRGSRAPQTSARILLFLASTLLLGGGCSVIIGNELAGKASGAGGSTGQGGAGGGGGATTAVSSSAHSSSAHSSSSSGPAPNCMGDAKDCDGLAWNGCEAHTDMDPLNCGECKKHCPIGQKCNDGSCEK